MKKLVIWRKYNNEFYYKVVGIFGKCDVGFKNSYGHEIVYSIDFNQVFYKPNFFKKVIKRLIRFLQKLEQKL